MPSLFTLTLPPSHFNHFQSLDYYLHTDDLWISSLDPFCKFDLYIQFPIRHFSPGCLIGTSNPCLHLKWNLFPQGFHFLMNTTTDYAFIQAKNLGSILSSFLTLTSKQQFLSILSPDHLPNLCTPLQPSMIPTLTFHHSPMYSGPI